jgi:NAD(P)-dependent dehydrogenase (short-subunit alcohol dehydrogenase family)
MSSNEFQGQVVLVTGAGSGMGRLASRRLSKAGASVAGLDLNEEGLRETGQECERFRAYPVDVTDARVVEATVSEAESSFGPIDRVMNAAAIMPTELLMNQDATLINRIMDINYCGTVNVTMATLPGMLERGRGDLINFASIAGWLPAMHFGAYNASKFAVVAFTEVLYHENRKSGVRFACVCPPPVATPLLDQAKSQPKVLEGLPPIPPEKVLDAIERDLDRGRLMVFPDATARISYWMRRLTPGLMWMGSHRAEGI